MTFSPDVLNYLAVLVSQQVVAASDPNFDESAAFLGKVRRELLAALNEADPKDSEEAD